MSNTLVWACLSPLAEVTIALLLALALYAKVPGRRFFRIAWFTPVLMSYVVVGILWVWIYNYDWGAANALLRALGLGSWARPWLGDPNVALPALIFVTTWMWTGFNMVVLLAAHPLAARRRCSRRPSSTTAAGAASSSTSSCRCSSRRCSTCSCSRSSAR